MTPGVDCILHFVEDRLQLSHRAFIRHFSRNIFVKSVTVS